MTEHSASCHCGAVAIHFTSPKTLQMTECNCSICRRTGYQHVFIPQEQARVQGEEHLTQYSFGTGAAKHYFCKICGIKPFYVPRSHPESYSVNLRCLDAPSLTISETITFDGQNWEKNIDTLRDATD